ncbi:guanine nucleotide-binding protein G(q) subunit alpha-like [Pseudorasbora parva]|uniref:guanine nucleotide-binding protein G(q) subunit alpha-like n=1 Tax=Pseudorasbora parva TaxID=51549 RepID=UPI00351E3653
MSRNVEMGVYCGCFLSEEERQAIAINKEIDRILSEEKKIKPEEFKLLLLGTADSGKSTFMKQMRIIHGKGYTEHDRRCFAKLIIQNILGDVYFIIDAMNTLNIPYSNPHNKIYAQQLQHLNILQKTQLQTNYIEAIHHLWADEGFKMCYERRGEYMLSDSTKYFIHNLDRIAAEDYIPIIQDILHVRDPTTGIIEHRICIEKIILRFVDVGGHRSERRRWIHCFNDVTSLIFVASLSEYDQCMLESNKENRMKESLALFNKIIHYPLFAKTSIILFLNKTDILAEKIQFSDLKAYFPEFEGKRQDVDDAMLFIRNLYTQKTVSNETKNSKNIYCHFICAMDTTNTRKIFNIVKDTVLTGGINEYKML